MVEKIDINTIKENEHNPRTISSSDFDRLKKSLQEFPEMLTARPLIVDEHNVVIGGNMRLRALKELGIKDVPVQKVKNWSEDKKKEFIIKDNLTYGSWDYEILTADWDEEKLNEWGLEIILQEEEKETEIDQNSFVDLSVLKLEYTLDDYIKVVNELKKIADTYENAVFKLLKL